jgi:hypothetical protein
MAMNEKLEVLVAVLSSVTLFNQVGVFLNTLGCRPAAK